MICEFVTVSNVDEIDIQDVDVVLFPFFCSLSLIIIAMPFLH